MAHHNLDLLDKKILRLIAEDARIPFLEVARSCNVSGAAIHQRIQKLTNLGILKGSRFIIDRRKWDMRPAHTSDSICRTPPSSMTWWTNCVRFLR